MVCCRQTTAAVPVDAARLAKSMSKGKGAGASFDPGTRILDEKLAKAKAQQAAREQEWKEKVCVCVSSLHVCVSACVSLCACMGDSCRRLQAAHARMRGYPKP